MPMPRGSQRSKRPWLPWLLGGLAGLFILGALIGGDDEPSDKTNTTTDRVATEPRTTTATTTTDTTPSEPAQTLQDARFSHPGSRGRVRSP